MAGCIAHARNGHISTSGLKSDVTIVFLDPDFLKPAAHARVCSDAESTNERSDIRRDRHVGEAELGTS